MYCFIHFLRFWRMRHLGMAEHRTPDSVFVVVCPRWPFAVPPVPSQPRFPPILYCVFTVAAAGGAGVSASEGVPVVPPASSPPVLPGATDVPDWVVQHAPGAVSGTTKPIPFVRGPLEGGTNCWCEQDASVFALRSASYLEDSVKTPSRPPPFRAVGVNCYKTNKPLHHAAAAMAELREYLAANSTHFFTIVCWLLPGSPSHCVVNLFIRTDGPDPVFDGLFKVNRDLPVVGLVS